MKCLSILFTASLISQSFGQVNKAEEVVENAESVDADKVLDQNDPHGLLAYGRLLDELSQGAQKPNKNSKFVGKWNTAEQGGAGHYRFAADGTFSFVFERNKGAGIWRETKKGKIFLSYDEYRKEKGVFQVDKLAFLEGEILKVHQFDYTNSYVRSPDDKKGADSK